MVSKGLRKRITGSIRFLLAAMKKFDQDHGFFLSAGITFNLLICLVPLILLLLGVLGTYLYSDREVLSYIRHYFENAIPSLDPRIMRNILRIIRDRKIVGVLGVGGLIWTSTWVFSSLRTAFSLIFQVQKERGFIRGKAIDLFMIFLAGIFLFMSMMLASGITFIQSYRIVPFLAIGPGFKFILRYLTPFFFTFSMFFLIYKIIPNMRVRFKTAIWTALFTSLCWELAKQWFGWYVLRIGRFSMVYGSLSTLAIFFLWIYYSSAILLLGGEMISLIEKRKFRLT